ncbi:hypothetical protein ACROYT_G036369 [Oculina patagonica]
MQIQTFGQCCSHFEAPAKRNVILFVGLRAVNSTWTSVLLNQVSSCINAWSWAVNTTGTSVLLNQVSSCRHAWSWDWSVSPRGEAGG